MYCEHNGNEKWTMFLFDATPTMEYSNHMNRNVTLMTDDVYKLILKISAIAFGGIQLHKTDATHAT